jgi:hypothetical protein
VSSGLSPLASTVNKDELSMTRYSPLDSAVGTRLGSIVARHLLIVVLVLVLVATNGVILIAAARTDVKLETTGAIVIHA